MSTDETGITLVVTDLDGTLWDTSLECHVATVETVRALQARPDVRLLAATGRRRNSARRAFAHNAISMPAVLLNGAVGIDFDTEELFHIEGFDNAALREVLAVLAAQSVAPVAYLADTTAVAVEGVTTSMHHLETLEGDLVWWTMEQLAARDDVLGLSMLGIDEQLVAGVLTALVAHPGAEVAGFRDELYAPFSLMIAPPNITKQRGIDAFCATRGLRPDRIIAIGDAGNDVPMLRAADIAVAVAGAAPEVAALADHTIGPPGAGGWAEVLDLL